MKPHPDKSVLDRLYSPIIELQSLADRHGIRDIFQDNGGKVLQVVINLGLEVMPKRCGNDLKDNNGAEYELKTINTRLAKSSSTANHLKLSTIERFRSTESFIFALYDDIKLGGIYSVSPRILEPLFSQWEEKIHAEGIGFINNPKIPLSLITNQGELVYRES